MQTVIIALDPATNCGYATPSGSGVWDLSPDKAAPSKGRKAEPEWARCGKLDDHLRTLGNNYLDHSVVLVTEATQGFTRFPHTLKIGHELRGVMKAVCYLYNWHYLEVQPTTLKKWATGSGKASKQEMVEAACKYEPDIISDDQADAVLLRHFGIDQLAEK